MAESQPPSWDELKQLMKRVDEICRESERVCDRADDLMKQKPFWPERRRTPRGGNSASPVAHGHE